MQASRYQSGFISFFDASVGELNPTLIKNLTVGKPSQFGKNNPPILVTGETIIRLKLKIFTSDNSGFSAYPL